MNKETLKIKKRGEDGNKIISVRIKEDILMNWIEYPGKAITSETNLSI